MNTKGLQPSEAVLTHLDGLLPDLEALYKDVHAHPELSMQESRTAGLAANRLRAAGYDVTTGIGTTGVVGLLHNGDGPTVLRSDLYAVAALAGAVVVVIGEMLRLPPAPVTVAGAALCFGLRLVAIRRGWQLPTARPRPREHATADHAPSDRSNQADRC